MSIIITTRLEASSTECKDGVGICNCFDVLEGFKKEKYYWCYLFHEELDEFKRCNECLAQERDRFIPTNWKQEFNSMHKRLKTEEKKGTVRYLKRLVSITNCEPGLKKYKITPAEHCQLDIIARELLKNRRAEFISGRLYELLQELDFHVSRKGIGYWVREKTELEKECKKNLKKNLKKPGRRAK